jgi:hypothetical protein
VTTFATTFATTFSTSMATTRRSTAAAAGLNEFRHGPLDLNVSDVERGLWQSSQVI